MESRLEIDADRLYYLSSHRLQAASRVVKYVATHPRSDTKEIAKEMGLSVAAVRYILGDLLAQEILTTINHLDDPQPRGRGRPATQYILKKALVVSTPPRRYSQLSDRLIETLLMQLGKPAVERIFQTMGTRAAQKTVERWKQNHRIPMSLVTFRRLLRQELNQVGYNADLIIKNNRVTIITRNCLYGEISRKYEGILCNFHNTYFPNLLSLACNCHVQTFERSSCMAQGGDFCHTELMPT
ncbi:MAG: helix-turn-helix transcriptional regulator [Promethearchaeota archaeon]